MVQDAVSFSDFWGMLDPSIQRFLQAGEEVIKIEGPPCTWDCCCQVTFNLYKAEDEDEIKVATFSSMQSAARVQLSLSVFLPEMYMILFWPHPQIGEISKKWTGMGEEMFTDADNFGVSFPVDLDVKVILTSIWDSYYEDDPLFFILILDPLFLIPEAKLGFDP